MSDGYTPHPMDAPGEFHVENDACILCHVPHDVAPELFGEHDFHCYVKRQPRDDAELSDMLRAIGSQCVGCVTYRGGDRAILQRIANVAAPDELRHHGVPEDIVPQRRDRVRFRAPDGTQASEVLQAFLEFMTPQARDGEGSSLYRFLHGAAGAREGGEAREVSWCEDHVHHVEVVPPRSVNGEWTLFHTGPAGLSFRIHDFLEGAGFTDQDWRSDDERRAGDAPAATPW